MREKLSALLEGTLLGFLPALTALSLLLVAKRNTTPSALGKPYIRTSR